MFIRVSCANLSVSWLLAEPEGPQKISPEILASFGARLTTEFEVVGTLRTAEGAGGYKIRRLQQLLRPVRPVDAALIACVAARATAK